MKNDQKDKMTLDDSELDDLIGAGPSTKNASNDHVDADHNNTLRTGKYPSYFRPTAPQSPPSSSSSSSSPSSLPSQSPSTSTSPSTAIATLSQIPTLLMYILMSFLLQCPRTAKLLSTVLLCSTVYILFNVSTRGERGEIGHVGYDFSAVHSKFDFEIGKIDHWCIDYSDDCQCSDPLAPSPRLTNTLTTQRGHTRGRGRERESFRHEDSNERSAVYKAKQWYNLHLNYTDAYQENPDHRNNIDVAFLGQSVIEALNGRHDMEDMMQLEQEQRLESRKGRGSSFSSSSSSSSDYFGHVNHMFTKRFKSPSEMNHNLYGVAMGIAGDQAGNILWRLLNGELNEHFNPPVWWIVIGMEEIARYQCSEEIVIMGILRIVEEIKNVKKDAKIVINGLFPMMSMRTNVPEPEDFLDAERSDVVLDEMDVDESSSHDHGHGHHHHHSEKGGHLLHRNLASRHHHSRDRDRDHHHRHHRHRSEDESESGDEGEEFDERNYSERKHGRKYKKDRAKSMEEHYNNMRERNKMKENHLKDLIHSLKHDRDSNMSDKEKAMRLDEMSYALEKMKRSNSRHEGEMRSYMKDMKRDSYNPVMKEKHSFRKDNFFHHHNRDPQHIPVWTAIHEINRQLHDFCRDTDQVAFYDPTPLFTSRTENGEYRLLTDYISTRGHPTQLGYKLWLNEVQQKVMNWKIEAEEDAKGDYSNIVENIEDDWEASTLIINHHYYGEDMDTADVIGGDIEDEGQAEEEEEEEEGEEIGQDVELDEEDTDSLEEALEVDGSEETSVDDEAHDGDE